jgi:hypothetical protein
VKIIVSSDLPDFRARWGKLVDEQLPYAQAQALNEFGFKAQKALRAVIPNYLDRPTPFTVRSPQVAKATKRQVVMAIFLRDNPRGGTSHPGYLKALVEGGQDKPKASENAFRRRGILGSTQLEVVGRSLRDRYGNLKGGGQAYRTLIQELRPIQGMARGQQHRAAKTRKASGMAPRSRYFVGRPGAGSQPLAVWRRDGKRGLMPVLLLASEGPTKSRFPFYTFVQKLFNSSFHLFMVKALDKALRTARVT